MTIRKWAEEYCFERGMFEDEARAVVDSLIETFSDETVKVKWDDPVDSFPKGVFNVIAVWLNKKAIEWIEANAPQAWYKECFR